MQITESIVTKLLNVVDAGLVNGVGQPEPGKMCVEAAVCYALGLPHGDDPKCVAPSLRSLKIRLNDSNWSSDTARAMGLRKLAVAQLGSRDSLNEAEFLTRLQTMTIRVIVPIAFRAVAKKLKEPHKTNLLDWADNCEADPTIENLTKAKATAAAAAAAYADAAAAAYAYAYADAADAYADAAAAAYAYAYADAADAYADAAAAAAYAAAYAAYAYADAAAAYAAAYADAAAAYAARDNVLQRFADEVLAILIDMKAPGCQWLHLCDL